VGAAAAAAAAARVAAHRARSAAASAAAAAATARRFAAAAAAAAASAAAASAVLAAAADRGVRGVLTYSCSEESGAVSELAKGCEWGESGHGSEQGRGRVEPTGAMTAGGTSP
jgi:hypothetical protein